MSKTIKLALFTFLFPLYGGWRGGGGVVGGREETVNISDKIYFGVYLSGFVSSIAYCKIVVFIYHPLFVRNYSTSNQNDLNKNVLITDHFMLNLNFKKILKNARIQLSS